MKTISKEKLLFNRPIDVPKLGTIYQPKMRDFLDNDFDIKRMIRAFSIKIELILPNAKELGFTNFDLFFLQIIQALESENDNEKDLLIFDLIESLKILYRTDNIKFDLEKCEVNINDKYILNKDNYNLLSGYIKIILDLDVNDLEEQRVKSEYELKVEKKRKEFEEKEKKDKKDEDESYTLYDLMDYIIHCDGTIYTYESVLDLTVYQMKNTFNLYKQKENYKIYLDYKTGGFQMDSEEPHWFFNKK